MFEPVAPIQILFLLIILQVIFSNVVGDVFHGSIIRTICHRRGSLLRRVVLIDYLLLLLCQVMQAAWRFRIGSIILSLISLPLRLFRRFNSVILLIAFDVRSVFDPSLIITNFDGNILCILAFLALLMFGFGCRSFIFVSFVLVRRRSLRLFILLLLRFAARLSFFCAQ